MKITPAAPSDCETHRSIYISRLTLSLGGRNGAGGIKISHRDAAPVVSVMLRETRQNGGFLIPHYAFTADDVLICEQ